MGRLRLDVEAIRAASLRRGLSAWLCSAGQPRRLSLREPLFPLHQVFQLQRAASALPRRVELLLNEARVVLAFLFHQSLMQAEQRTRIPRIAVEIFAKDFLSSGRIPVHQQSGTERFADRKEP